MSPSKIETVANSLSATMKIALYVFLNSTIFLKSFQPAVVAYIFFAPYGTYRVQAVLSTLPNVLSLSINNSFADICEVIFVRALQPLKA